MASCDRIQLGIGPEPLRGDAALDEVKELHERRIRGEGPLGLGHPPKLPVKGLHGVRGSRNRWPGWHL